jgi:hypothetical protein
MVRIERVNLSEHNWVNFGERRSSIHVLTSIILKRHCPLVIGRLLIMSILQINSRLSLLMVGFPGLKVQICVKPLRQASLVSSQGVNTSED